MSNPICNKKTGLPHTGLLPTFVSGICFLLVKFGAVSAVTLDTETVTVIIGLSGIAAVVWRQKFPQGILKWWRGGV